MSGLVPLGELGFSVDYEDRREELSAAQSLGVMLRDSNWLVSTGRSIFHNAQDVDQYELAGDEEMIDNGYSPREFLDSYGFDQDLYDRYLPEIINTETPAEARKAIHLLEKQRADREQAMEMGFGTQVWTGAIAGVLDPITIASMALIPVTGGGSAAVTAGRIAGVAMGEQVLNEAALHADQPLRTVDESVTNILATGALAGITGYGLGRWWKGADPKQQSEVMSDKPLIESDIREHLDAARHVPEPDEGMPPHTPRDRGYASESLEELEARAQSEGRDVSELIEERRADYDSEIEETAPFKQKLLRMKQWNPIMGLQNSQFLFAREAASAINGGSLAQVGNVAGRVAGKISAPIQARINSALRFGAESKKVTAQFREDFYGSIPRAMWKEFTGADLDELAIRIMRSNGEEMADVASPSGFRELKPWEQDFYQRQRAIANEREVFLHSRGYHDDILDRQGWTTDKLTVTRQKLLDDHAKAVKGLQDAKQIKRLEQKLKLQTDIIDEIAPLVKKAETGDFASANKLLKILSGDKNYVAQSWSRSALRDAGKDAFIGDALASTKAKLSRLSKSDDIPKSLQKAYALRLKNWDEVAEAAEIATAYDKLVGSVDAGLGGVDDFADALMEPTALKARSFMIEQDDAAMAKYLDKSFHSSFDRADMTVIPYLELKNAGYLPGTKAYEDRMAAWKAEFDVRAYGLKGKELEALEEEFAREVGRIETMIKHLMHKQNESPHGVRKFVSYLKDYQIVRALGSVLFPSLADPGMAAMKSGGIAQFAKFMAPSMSRMKAEFKGMGPRDAAYVANINEIQTALTLNRLSDAADEGWIERGGFATAVGKIVQGFMKGTGLPHFNQINKTNVVLQTEDRLIRLAMGAERKQRDITWLAQHGFDEEKLARVRDLFERYGYTHGEGDSGVRMIDHGRIFEEYADGFSSTKAVEPNEKGIASLGLKNADEYIELINPDGKRLSPDERPRLLLGDMDGMLPEGASRVAEKDGVFYFQDGDDFYAVADDQVVGFSTRTDEGTDLSVVEEMQGRGIGEELSFLYRQNNPTAPSGGLTEAGERTARKVFERASPSEPTSQIKTDFDLSNELGAFMNWISEKNVVTPGVGDIPGAIIKRSEMGALIQFKSFGFASIEKTLNPMIQSAAQGDKRVIEGVLSAWAASTLGYFAYMYSRGRGDEIEDMSYQQIAYNSLLRSGLLPMLDTGIGMTQKATNNFLGLGSVIGLQPISSYYARSWATELLGPGYGLMSELQSLTSMASSRATNREPLTHQDWARIARLIPFNNLFYIRAVLENGLKD